MAEFVNEWKRTHDAERDRGSITVAVAVEAASRSHSNIWRLR